MLMKITRYSIFCDRFVHIHDSIVNLLLFALYFYVKYTKDKLL